jgi:hypothetical protein
MDYPMQAGIIYGELYSVPEVIAGKTSHSLDQDSAHFGLKSC